MPAPFCGFQREFSNENFQVLLCFPIFGWQNSLLWRWLEYERKVHYVWRPLHRLITWKMSQRSWACTFRYSRSVWSKFYRFSLINFQALYLHSLKSKSSSEMLPLPPMARNCLTLNFWISLCQQSLIVVHQLTFKLFCTDDVPTGHGQES